MKKRIISLSLILGLALPSLLAQTAPTQQKPPQETLEDILRITTDLVQTDVVVMDKNEQPVSGLKIEDFELYDNGKKQDLQFVEFISVDEPTAGTGGEKTKDPSDIDTTVPRDVTARDLRRVMAFVIDDVTIPAEDMSRVRQLLTEFVDNKMREGDLVAIVRTVGGKGLLEQFTSDRQMLRRAISQLGVRSIPPHLALTGQVEGRISTVPSPAGDVQSEPRSLTGNLTVSSGLDFEGPTEGTNQIPRAALALSVANQVVNSLRQLPGRKNLTLISGGLPLFDLARSGAIVADVSQLFRLLTDNATRSGVVINTMDVRGVDTKPSVARFSDTPARSGLANINTEPRDVDPLETPGASGGVFGDERRSTGPGSAGGRFGGDLTSSQLGLRTLANYTGGVSVMNTNNFAAGLDRVIQRSRAYYRLAYRPTEKFDNKFHRVDVKVRRAGARVYTAEGYVAREDNSGRPATKEEEIIKAGVSPLARRDLDVAAELQYQFIQNNQAQLDINVFIDARKLSFNRSADAKYVSSFDVVGFVFDQFGKNRGGISQTINTDFSEQDYQRALKDGIGYQASTQAPPGSYQLRLVVREAGTGKIGTVSRYFEVPDLSNNHLMMSSVMLYQVSPAGPDKTPLQLAATRVISRKHDLRHAVTAYNVKLEGGKPQAKSQVMISQGGKLLFKEPEQPIQTAGTAAGQFIKVGQLGLSRVPPGRYVLTLVITDPLADKKRQIVSRSIDFTVVD